MLKSVEMRENELIRIQILDQPGEKWIRILPKFKEIKKTFFFTLNILWIFLALNFAIAKLLPFVKAFILVFMDNPYKLLLQTVIEVRDSFDLLLPFVLFFVQSREDSMASRN